MSSPAVAAPGSGTTTGGLSHRQIMIILSGLMAGMFLAALDQTVVSTAIRTIGDDLHGLNLQAWVTTAYLITSTISTPLYGKLSDIYGRRPFFLLAISLFIIGSLACSFATSMYMLAAFRAFQGIGAGGLMSLALATMGDLLPPRERAKYQGYFMAVFGTASVLGPLIGGLFAGTHSILGIAGWRWVFLINVPIGLLALAIVYRVLHIPHTARPHRIDYYGAVALIVCLVPWLTVAEQAPEWGWGSGKVLGLAVLGAVGLVGFIVVEFRMGDDALLPVRLFRSSTFSVVQVAGTLVGVVMFGAILTLPLYLQIVRGATPTESGLQMLAMTVGLMGASVFSAQLTARTGRYRIFPIVGMGLTVISTSLLGVVLRVDTSKPALWAMMFFIGFGVGLCMQSLTLATQNAVQAKDMGVATSAATFFRQVGGTVGVGIFLSMLFSKLGSTVPKQIAISSGDPGFLKAAAQQAGSTDQSAISALLAHYGGQMKDDSSFLNVIPSVLAHPFRAGFVDAMRPVYFTVAAVAVVAFIVLLFSKETPLRTISALQERQSADAAGGAPAEGTQQVAADSPEVTTAGQQIVPTTGRLSVDKPARAAGEA